MGISINQILRFRDSISPKWVLVAGLAYLNMIILNGLYAFVLLITLAVHGKWSGLHNELSWIILSMMQLKRVSRELSL